MPGLAEKIARKGSVLKGQKNAEGQRYFISVQLPEEIQEKQRAAIAFAADLRQSFINNGVKVLFFSLYENSGTSKMIYFHI